MNAHDALLVILDSSDSSEASQGQADQSSDTDEIIDDPAFEETDSGFPEEATLSDDANDRDILRSKDKSEEWHHTPPRQQRRTNAENIVRVKMGFTKDVMRRADSPVTAFSNFITTEMLEKNS